MPLSLIDHVFKRSLFMTAMSSTKNVNSYPLFIAMLKDFTIKSNNNVLPDDFRSTHNIFLFFIADNMFDLLGLFI